jgi:hypothetical protein
MDDLYSILSYNDDLYCELIRRSRTIPPGDRVMMGPRFFENACWLAMGLIHAENPELTETECRQELSRRIKEERRREEEGLFFPVEESESE